jgi:hypothetical protein
MPKRPRSNTDSSAIDPALDLKPFLHDSDEDPPSSPCSEEKARVKKSPKKDASKSPKEKGGQKTVSLVLSSQWSYGQNAVTQESVLTEAVER